MDIKQCPAAKLPYYARCHVSCFGINIDLWCDLNRWKCVGDAEIDGMPAAKPPFYIS
jgi:hypothetical protein